eukprot:TRINITY_DN48698_c0_g1_i1.p1 TRINITY_DN48698_c0_g1~~TRINITY_DN48698_c0_g1_i1.p1  ORF type:complete len:107 (+),score=21.77 TRINITY_DN48698_c0_g1_i1:23-343(+)
MFVMLRIFFFLMIRRPPRSTLSSSSAASDVYKRQDEELNRYSLIHRCAHERTALTNMDRVEGGPQVSNAFIKAFPAPARSLVKSILWILAIIMTCLLYTSPSPRDS